MKRDMPLIVSTEEMDKQRQAMGEIAALPHRPMTYHIVTYGCQMNAHDSEKIAGMLDEMGLVAAPSREDAGLILFNTCCIRDGAERRALGNMSWLKRLKQSRPDLVLCVCGCMMQQPKMAKIILRQYPFFDVAFGTHTLHRFPELLLRALDTRRQIIHVSDDENATIAEGMPIHRENTFSAFLTVMYGCDNYCSYCIVPYVRGRERSRSARAILAEAEILLKGGVREITLLGQNVNSFGNDLASGESFPRLLRQLDTLGIPRIRFMTSHPKDLSDDLIESMAVSPRVAKHLHLPVQSGSDPVLSAMNRVYTRGEYLRKISSLRAAMPDIALTTDFIVGFPGETEQDFQDTLDLADALRFDSAFTFIFSPREGTLAAKLPDRVSTEVSRDRIARLIAMQETITMEIHQSLLHSTQSVLVTETSKRGANQVSGKCERNITVNFEGSKSQIGAFVNVRIKKAGKNTLGG